MGDAIRYPNMGTVKKPLKFTVCPQFTSADCAKRAKSVM